MRPVFFLSLCSVIVAVAAMLVLIRFFSFHPIHADLATEVLGEWLSDFKPEREVLFFRFFVLTALLTHAVGVWQFQSWFARGPRLSAIDKRTDSWSCWDWAGLVFIVFFIFVPDASNVLSRITDDCFHIDSFFTAPGWAVIHGLKLNMDVVSEYSVVIPALASQFLNGINHFDYTGILTLEMAMGAVYFCIFYVFLRIWINQRAVAIAGVCAGISMQMFHPGVFPLVWQFPSATVIRVWWDMPMLLALLAHLRTGRPVFLWIAASCVGIAMVWTLDVGVYLWLSLAAYAALFAYRHWQQRQRLWGTLAFALCAPFAGAFLVLWGVQGALIFQPVFWRNTFEFASLFLLGFGALPVVASLNEHHYLAFIFGFAFPVLYVFILLSTATLCFLRKIAWENIFVCVLCVYGLGLYHYYVVRSAPTSYAVVGLPLVAVGVWGLGKGIARLKPLAARMVLAIIMAFLGVTLYLNPLVRGYPGLWNHAARIKLIPTGQKLDFSSDVSLIDRLTDRQERVVLVCGREVKMLMEAKRKPFFYYFPLIYSDRMDIVQFRGTYMWTWGRMRRTLQELETRKPTYVFVEKKLFSGLPEVYYQHFETLTILMSYFHQNYEPVESGKYLFALKRRNS